MSRPSTLLAALLVAALGAGTLALADEVNVPGLFDTAKASFQEARYGKCLADLNLLVQEVTRLRSARLQKALPGAPEGWTAEEPEAQSAGILGLGLSIRRAYRKGEQGSVTVNLLVDSPAASSMTMYFQNPQFLSPNQKVVTIGDRRAVLETEDGGSANVKLLLNANTTLLEIDGDGVPKADVEALAKAIDLAGLEKALQE